jgi:hypothetical protein
VATACEQCEILRAELAAALARNADLGAQLHEVTKLVELQKADLERYRKTFEASRPNHPERVAREQLQLAFRRVLESLSSQPPANDTETVDETATDNNEPGEGRSPGGDKKKGKKQRHEHGRRCLDLENAPVVEQRIEPDEIVAAQRGGNISATK